MKIRVAALDDNREALSKLEKDVKVYNRQNKDDIHIDLATFADPELYLANFDHDMAIIDIDLCLDIDGFDVARSVNNLDSKAVIIMMSGDVTQIDAEECSSFLPKLSNFKIVSELVDRYRTIRMSLLKRMENKLEVFDRAKVYRYHASI